MNATHDTYMEVTQMEEICTELYEKLSRLQWLLKRQHLQNHVGHGPLADPSRGQGRVLALLKLQPEITTKDLGYLLGIRQQSLNELLGKLEKGGYVTRVPSEADRRVMIVTLTDKGKQEEQPKSDFAGIFDCLSREEQAAFGEYLDRIISALEEKLPEEDREDMEQWFRAARSRMGGEQLEKLMMRRIGRHMRKFAADGKWDADDCFGFGDPTFRGPFPCDMPDGEDFDADYDGPVRPGGPRPHGRHGRPTPPPPPKSPDDNSNED